MSRAVIARLFRPLRRLWRDEAGNATIEFVFAVPLVLFIFMGSIESGFYMIREVMMERGLDLVMRDFRLGRLASLDQDGLRDLVCDATPILGDCGNRLKVWIGPIDTSTWQPATQAAYCGDGNGTLTPQTAGNVVHSTQNEIVFVRVCTIEQPIFPSTGIGLRLRADSQTGGYQIAVATVAVNEPY